MKYQTSKLAGFFAVAIAVIACGGGKEPNIEVYQDMMDGPGVKAQEHMLIPPEGTVPMGFKPYKFKGNPEGASSLRNPVSVTEESLARGQKMFETFCLVCHGPTGKGDGQIAEKMNVKPPALISAKVKGWTDGRVFHVITDGQGVMGTYATQISSDADRWSIVHYIRKLQKAQ